MGRAAYVRAAPANDAHPAEGVNGLAHRITVGYLAIVGLTEDDTTATTRAITRRFLQTRRRAPLHDAEVTGLLTPDVEYAEVLGEDVLTVVGSAAVLTLMRRYWAGIAPGARMSVIRHTVMADGTAVGHWRREVAGQVVNGRDTYTLRDGRISRVVVEEFPGVDVPSAAARIRLAASAG